MKIVLPLFHAVVEIYTFMLILIMLVYIGENSSATGKPFRRVEAQQHSINSKLQFGQIFSCTLIVQSCFSDHDGTAVEI